ncbi:MAG: hypothetical protein D6732_04850 [Methanobacteriota archaeon]|nr:MAG: hypothetical protein D6732_04850 [Euryarchaeota archaeon]
MTNVPTLIYSGLSSIMIILGGLLLYLKTNSLNTRHLKLVSLGIVLQAGLPVSFIPQAFLEGNQYTEIITFAAILGAITLLIGMVLTVWNLQVHQAANVPQRFLVLLLLAGFSMGWIIIGTEVNWDGTNWIIKRNNAIRLLMYGPVAWILVEYLRLFINGARKNPSKWAKVAILYPTSYLISFFLLVFREELPFPTSFYQFPSAMGALALVLALTYDPTSLIVPDIVLEKVILAQRSSGLAAVSYPIEQEIQHSLTSAGLQGIFAVIKEISGRDELPPKLGYADYTIGVYPGKENSIFAISTGSHPLLDGIFKNLIAKWDIPIIGSNGSISGEHQDTFAADIHSKLRIFLSNNGKK